MPTEEKVTRKLRAILSADVKGYSLLMANDEAYTIKKLEAYRDSMSDLIRSHSGRVVDAVGDNLLAEFSSVVDAVRCAVEIQKDLQQKNADLPTDKSLEFRIGVNIGDVIQEGDRIYGNGVNVAARIEALAEPGGICISRNAYSHVRDKLELGYEYLGEHRVKNIKRPVRVYKVLMNPEDAGKLIGDVPKPVTKIWIWATAVLAAIVITTAVSLVYQKMVEPEYEPARVEEMAYPLPEKPSVAVLPFVNMSGDPSKEFISDGITEQIITSLSKVPRLFVISRTSTFIYKNKPVKVQQVAEDLGIRYVLEGSIQQSGDKIRITAQLIDALTGRHIWAERYERNYKDIFELQDEITFNILSEMQVKLTAGERYRLTLNKFPNLKVYEKIMEGTTYVRAFNIESNETARRLILEAIELDPEYYGSYNLMASVHFMDYWLGSSISPSNSLDQAIELLQKSIALEENNDSAYSLLCHVYALKRQFEKSIEAGQKAIETNPNSYPAIVWLAMTLGWAGKPEEAIALYQQALRLSPFAPSFYYLNLGHAYRTADRCEEAIKEYKKALHLTPKNLFAFRGLSICYGLLGQEEESRAAASEMMKINPKATIDYFKKTLPQKNRDLVERWADVLRKAGVPEYPPGKKSKKPSIAVLPFDNLSDDPEQGYLADGLADELIGDLAKIDGIFVISRNSAFTYKGKSVKIQDVAKELNVRYVLEGSVQRSGDKIRIRAQLIDGETDHHVWAESYDGVVEDIFELQDEITGKIVAELAVKLTEDEKGKISDKGTDNILAYEAFLKGKASYHKHSSEGCIIAIENFENAIRIDPGFSRAYAALGLTYHTATNHGFVRQMNLKYSIARLKAVHYLKLAMESPTFEAYLLSSAIELHRRHFNSSLSLAKKAISISPNESDGYKNLGALLIFSGSPEEGIQYLKKSLRLDPNPQKVQSTNALIGVAHFSLDQFEQAVDYITKIQFVNPEMVSYSAVLAASYAFLDDKEKAKLALDNYLLQYSEVPLSIQLLYYAWPFKNQQVFDQLARGLIKAGFSGDPNNYYKVVDENKLSEKEIRATLFGRTQIGSYPSGEWWFKFDNNGNFEYSDTWAGKDTGQSWIERDYHCLKFEYRKEGHINCDEYYKNPDGNAETKSEYLGISYLELYTFSVEK